jgi:formylglycine-generating enzyme required for sulfatase activity
MGCNPSKFKGANRPVEQVSWDDCQLFISKLNSLTGKKFRLPTYEEWKFASLGGKKSKSYRYYGSDSLDTVAWYEKNSGKETHPVRTKTPNELGLYDMNGNVWEWCLDMYEDLYERYKSSSRPSPVDASSGYHRLLGGSYLSNSERCLSSLLIHESDRSFIDAGLRLVLCSNCHNVIDKNILLNKVSTKDRSESTESSVASIDDMDYRDNGWPIDGDWPWYCP